VSSGFVRLNIIFSVSKKWVWVWISMFAMTPVFADQFDTVNYIASSGINFDDNVFRLPPNADAQTYLGPGKTSKSDSPRFLSIGIDVDKKYLSQALTFKASGTIYKYNNFSNLNYTSSSIKGAWNGRVGSKLTGGLSVARTQTLNNPADTRVYSRNLNTTNNINFNGDGWVSSNWHLLLGLSKNQVSNSSNTVNYLGSHTSMSEWGGKYEPIDGGYIALMSRNIKQPVDGVTQANTSFNEKQWELKANYQITGKSALSAYLMNIRREYDYFAQQNYSGNQGGVNYSLDVSGKTSLNVSLKRTLNSWFDVASSHYVADSISIAPKWQVTSKAAMQMAFSQESNDYRSSQVSSALTRKDVVQSASIGMDWIPQRTAVLSASFQHNRRSSSPAAYSRFEFSDNTVSVSAQVNF
jgi:exopolysaccharide biosynthesis operon protein EpsL